MEQENGAVHYGQGRLPATIGDAETRIEDLVQEVQEIDAQLSTKTRVNPLTGEQCTVEEHKSWRQRAMTAKLHKVRELKLLKRWIKEERTRFDARSMNLDFDDPKSLMHGAFLVIHSLPARGIQLTEQEQRLTNLLRDYLQLK